MAREMGREYWNGALISAVPPTSGVHKEEAETPPFWDLRADWERSVFYIPRTSQRSPEQIERRARKAIALARMYTQGWPAMAHVDLGAARRLLTHFAKTHVAARVGVAELILSAAIFTKVSDDTAKDFVSGILILSDAVQAHKSRNAAVLLSNMLMSIGTDRAHRGAPLVDSWPPWAVESCVTVSDDMRTAVLPPESERPRGDDEPAAAYIRRIGVGLAFHVRGVWERFISDLGTPPPSPVGDHIRIDTVFTQADVDWLIDTDASSPGSIRRLAFSLFRAYVDDVPRFPMRPGLCVEDLMLAAATDTGFHSARTALCMWSVRSGRCTIDDAIFELNLIMRSSHSFSAVACLVELCTTACTTRATLELAFRALALLERRFSQFAGAARVCKAAIQLKDAAVPVRESSLCAICGHGVMSPTEFVSISMHRWRHLYCALKEDTGITSSNLLWKPRLPPPPSPRARRYSV